HLRAQGPGPRARTVPIRHGPPAPGGILPIATLADLTIRLSELTGRSRLYLRGHGSWRNQTIGGWDARAVAQLLHMCNLPAVQVISIVSCKLGRGLGAADGCRLADSANSFASKFHKSLWKDYDIKTTVFARLYSTLVL